MLDYPAFLTLLALLFCLLFKQYLFASSSAKITRLCRPLQSILVRGVVTHLKRMHHGGQCTASFRLFRCTLSVRVRSVVTTTDTNSYAVLADCQESCQIFTVTLAAIIV